jgi:hypothetical protein
MLRRLIQTVAAVAAVAAVASVAYAAIPSSTGAITACVDSKGALKVIDAEAGVTCGNGKYPLTWNQQGPAGPQGAPGSTNGYYKTGTTTALQAGAGNTTLASLTLPAGSYLVYAKATVNSAASSGATCYLAASGVVGEDLQNVNVNSSFPYARVWLMRALTLSGASTVTLSCGSGLGATVSGPAVSAVKVGTLDWQS